LATKDLNRIRALLIGFPVRVAAAGNTLAKGKTKRIPQMLREAIEQQPKTRFDRAHFESYGDFSLVFETVYFVAVPDYNVYMDIQQGRQSGYPRTVRTRADRFYLPDPDPVSASA
jgi:hypothetical protein